MFDYIGIKDFQAIGDAPLDLKPFTVIVGESNVGKSALIRAIRAAATNAPGQGVIRNGAKQADVALSSPENIVVWAKGKSASYELGDGTTFDKARGVPEEVADYLRIAPIQIGELETDPNFHSQFDKPYLVGETGTIRAKVLGELSGINVLYMAMQDARHRLSTVAKGLTTGRAELSRLEDEIDALSWIPERQTQLNGAGAWLEVASQHQNEIETKHSVAVEISELEERVDDYYCSVHQLAADLQLLEQVDFDAADRAEALRSASSRINALADAYVSSVGDEMNALNTIEYLQLQIEAIPTCPTCGGVV